jgi:hypothetical protein
MHDSEPLTSHESGRALWSNVLGSIGIASTSGSVELQTGQNKIHIPATWIFALLPWEYAQGHAIPIEPRTFDHNARAQGPQLFAVSSSLVLTT